MTVPGSANIMHGHYSNAVSEWWMWATLILCQVCILVWAELEDKYGEDAPQIGFLPKLCRASLYLTIFLCAPSLIAATGILVPDELFYRLHIILRAGWIIFYLAVYFADMYVCLLWAKRRHRANTRHRRP
jgi:hypothetical protein